MGRKNQQGSSSAAAAVTESDKVEEMVKQTEKRRDGRKEKQKGREEGKEKQKEKGRDGRKEKPKGRAERKEKEKQTGREEGDATATGHQFFKVFFPEQSGERLKIPPPFLEYLEEEPDNRPVSLKGPSGNTWQVVLTSDSQGLGFTKGWKEFARDHSLVLGHFMVFTYDGNSQFSVTVFCASGVEDKSALDVQPRKEVVVKLEEEERAEDVDVGGMSEVSAPTVEGNGTTRKRARQVDDVMENGTAPKRHSGIQKKPEKRKPEATIDTSKAAPTDINSNKEYSCLLDEYSCSNRTRIRSKDVSRMGTFASKKNRQPVIISQRRPVTEEEKNHAFKRAKEFKSKNPFAVQVMMESYVYVGFFMNIPCEFVRESLPQASRKMTLWDPQGKSWEVKYVYYNDRSVASFSGGWGKFSVGNNLEKFDVCVFELFKEDNIKVHIYRVVPEITPLIRKSSM